MPVELADPAADCPKHMVYGPCGGVRFDGACEIDETLPCPFVASGTLAWHGVEPPAPERPAGLAAAGPTPAAGRLRRVMASRPLVLADFPARALDGEAIAEAGAILAGTVDAVLSGDHGQARVQFPPALRARLIADAGLVPWLGVNTRDRNRVALEGELAGLHAVGAAGVHCITGDHTDSGTRPDAMPVFDLDSVELASLAREAGHLVSVAESPLAPPVAGRPQRLLEKQRAGAELCVVNHAGGVEPVRRFIGQATDLGVTVGYIPCVPIIFDADSASVIRSFTSLAEPPGYIDGILAAADPVVAGIEAAVELSAAMAEIPGVVGVDLSGGPLPGTERVYTEAVAEIGRRLLDRFGAGGAA